MLVQAIAVASPETTSECALLEQKLRHAWARGASKTCTRRRVKIVWATAHRRRPKRVQSRLESLTCPKFWCIFSKRVLTKSFDSLLELTLVNWFFRFRLDCTDNHRNMQVLGNPSNRLKLTGFTKVKFFSRSGGRLAPMFARRCASLGERLNKTGPEKRAAYI